MFKTAVKSISTAAAAAVVAVAAFAPTPAKAQQGICMGQVMAFGGNFCPRSWANADGQLLPISSYSALFSIFGTMYGGDGRTTFGLPDLRNRSIVHVGNGPGIGSSGAQGAKSGTTSFTLLQSQMPSHNHGVQAATDAPDNQNPTGDLLGRSQIYKNESGSTRARMANDMILNSGGNQAVSKRSPMQVIRYCVALEGVYCSRS